MRRYTIVVEKAQENYSAYVPDLTGCIATGKTVDETMASMHEAIALHLETMEELGIPIPEPTTSAEALRDQGDSYLIEVAD